MSKISYNQLQEKIKGLKSILNNNKEYNFNLVYIVQKNISIAKDEQDIILNSLPASDHDFITFQQKHVDIIRDCGGELKRTEDGQIQLTNIEDLDKDKYNDQYIELEKEYKEALQRQEKILQERNYLMKEKEIEIEWYPIKKELFPDSIKPEELPISIIDLIE